MDESKNVQLLIPLPDRSLASTVVGGRVVSAMIEQALVVARDVFLEQSRLDALVREGKRIRNGWGNDAGKRSGF